MKQQAQENLFSQVCWKGKKKKSQQQQQNTTKHPQCFLQFCVSNSSFFLFTWLQGSWGKDHFFFSCVYTYHNRGGPQDFTEIQRTNKVVEGTQLEYFPLNNQLFKKHASFSYLLYFIKFYR